jgi:hypothetical protein
MTMSNPDDLGGDQPDTIGGRLRGIARLIDTLDDEPTPARRRLRLDIIAGLLQDVADQVDDLS